MPQEKFLLPAAGFQYLVSRKQPNGCQLKKDCRLFLGRLAVCHSGHSKSPGLPGLGFNLKAAVRLFINFDSVFQWLKFLRPRCGSWLAERHLSN